MTFSGVPIGEYGREKKPEPAAPLDLDINALHRDVEVDVSAKSIHHTLGPLPFQASPGAHTHDGTSSKKLDAANLMWGDDEISPQFKVISINWASGFSGTAWGATFGPLKMLRWNCDTPMSQDVLANPVGNVPANSGYRPPYTVVPMIYGNGGWYAVGALNAVGNIVVRIANNVTNHFGQAIWLDAPLP